MNLSHDLWLPVRVSRNFLDYKFSDQTNLASLLEEPFPLVQGSAMVLVAQPELSEPPEAAAVGLVAVQPAFLALVGLVAFEVGYLQEFQF